MDSKDFTIGVLSTTAVILFTALVIIGTRPPTALAGGMTTTNGEYTLTVGTLSANNEEVVYVINGPQEALIAYRFNAGKRQIEIASGIDLAAARRSATPPSQQPGKKKKSRGRRGRNP